MKMLFLLPSLCLMSCSSSNYYGIYEFRLGKTDGAHFGLTVELKEAAAEKHEGAQQMTLSADLGKDFSINSIIEQYTEDEPLVSEILKALLQFLPSHDQGLEGYYSLTEFQNDKYGTRVKVGSDYFIDLAKQIVPSIEELIDVNKLPEIFEMFAAAYVNSNTFTFQIPVSIEDLQYQLTWYGYLLDPTEARLIDKLDTSKLPGPEGEARIGNHPGIVKDDNGNIVSNDVEIMNENFVYEFSHTYLFQTDEYGLREPVGSFITQLNDKDQKCLYFKPFEEDLPLSVSGEVSITNPLGGTTWESIEFAYTTNGHEVVATHNGKTGDDEGFIVKDKEFKFKTFMKKAFEFRDYHDVKVGLTKI